MMNRVKVVFYVLRQFYYMNAGPVNLIKEGLVMLLSDRKLNYNLWLLDPKKD